MSEKDIHSSQHRPIGVLTVVLYVFWGFFLFLSGLYLFFPRDQLRTRLEQELSQDRGDIPWATGYQVHIGELDIHFFHPGIHLGDIHFSPKSTKSELFHEKENSHSKPIQVDSFDFSISWWDLLLGRLPPPSIQAELRAFGGQITLQLEKEDGGSDSGPRSKEEHTNYHVTLNANKLQLSEISKPWLPIPMEGVLELSTDLTLPMDPKTKRIRLRGLQGTMQVSMEKFNLSDGKTKLSLDSIPEAAQPFVRPLLQKFVPNGIPIPRIHFGQLNSRIRFQNEQAILEGWQFHNNNSVAGNPPQNRIVPMNLLMDGTLALNDNFGLSSLNLYLRVGPWRKFFDQIIDGMKESFDPQKDAETIKELETSLRPLADLIQMQERADGFLGFFASGPLTKPSVIIQKNNPEHMTLQTTIK